MSVRLLCAQTVVSDVQPALNVIEQARLLRTLIRAFYRPTFVVIRHIDSLLENNVASMPLR